MWSSALSPGSSPHQPSALTATSPGVGRQAPRALLVSAHQRVGRGRPCGVPTNQVPASLSPAPLGWRFLTPVPSSSGWHLTWGESAGPLSGSCWGRDQPHHQCPWGRAGLQGEESARILVVPVPGAGLSICAYAVYLFGSQQSQEIRTVFISVLLIRKLRLREVKSQLSRAGSLEPLHEWSWSPFGAGAGSVTNMLRCCAT